MSASLQMAALWGVGIALVAAIGLSLRFLPHRRERLRHLHAVATLLRSSDPNVRTEALERAHALAARDRATLANLLRRELMASSRDKSAASAQQRMTAWFIRQILGLLADPRTAVRMDAARLLRAVIRSDGGQLPSDREEEGSLAPAVTAAVELAGGRVLAANQASRQQTRVLAFAEMLEAGLRPVVLGVRALEGVGEEAMEPLASALRDRSPRVRRSLCEVLAAMGGERSIEMLIPLLQDPSPELRARAAQALGSLKAVPASSQLTQLLRDPIADVRAAAAAALCETAVETSCGPIIEALTEECRRDDTSEAACTAMIEAIARLSDGGRPELAQAFTRLPRPLASRLAAALESSGVIDRWLNQTDGGGRDGVIADLLSTAAGLGVSAPFLQALDSTEELVRLRSAGALGNSRKPEAVGAVTALLGDPEAEVRAAAVESLARQGEPESLVPLAQAAADPDGEVRLTAVRGLRTVLAQRPNWQRQLLPTHFDLEAALAQSRHALLSAAGDADESVRVEAASALGLSPSPESAEMLAGLALGDASDAVRAAAAESLVGSGLPQVRRFLAAALEDAEEGRRAHAVELLGAMGGQEAGREICDALRDSSPAVRRAALAALSRLEVAALGERLVAELHSPDAEVRAGVARELGRAGAPGCVGPLVEALADPAEEVRVNALCSLARFGRSARKHEDAIAARLSDPRPRVREAAAAALSDLRRSWAEAGDSAELVGAAPVSPAGAAALVERAAEGDLAPVLQALRNPESARSVADFLADAGRAKLGALLVSLRDADEPNRARALSALAKAVRDEGAAGACLAELQAIQPAVRLIAVEFAGRLGTPEAVTALLEVLHQDPLPEVRSRAASVLADISGERVRAGLLRARKEDPDEIVRRVAERALEGNRAREGGAPQVTPLRGRPQESDSPAPGDRRASSSLGFNRPAAG